MGHLILARKLGERVIITAPGGTRLVVQLVDIRDNGAKARIGFTAPGDYSVHREEVQARIDEIAALNRGDGPVIPPRAGGEV